MCHIDKSRVQTAHVHLDHSTYKVPVMLQGVFETLTKNARVSISLQQLTCALSKDKMK